MNACIITGSFYPVRCGIADYTFILAQELSKKDVNISVITGYLNGEPPRYSIDKVDVHRIMNNWNVFELFKLIRALKQIKLDIIHIQYAALIYHNHILINFIPFFIKVFIPKVKVIITFHEMIGPGIFWRLWFFIFLKFADSIIVTSRINIDWLLKFNYSLKKKISLVPVGSSIPEEKMRRPTDAERNALRQSLGIDNQTFAIASFGFIFPDKNLEMLIRVTKMLIDKGSNIKLMFIGGTSDMVCGLDQRYKSKLLNYAKDMEADNFISHAGFIESKELSRMLLSMDAGVLLYKDGASSSRSSFVTVLSCGLPIITTLGASAGELVNYRNTLLLRNGDEKQLKNYIEELINSSELRRNLSCGGLELSKRYSWGTISKETVDIYNSLINKRLRCLNA